MSTNPFDEPLASSTNPFDDFAPTKPLPVDLGSFGDCEDLATAQEEPVITLSPSSSKQRGSTQPKTFCLSGYTTGYRYLTHRRRISSRKTDHLYTLLFGRPAKCSNCPTQTF